MAQRLRLGALILALGLLAGCNDTESTTTTPAKKGARSLSHFAYREVREQAIKACSLVPRRVLYEAFARGSSGDPSGHVATDNGIALLYAEDVDINPVPLQRAAYDGCLTGLRQQRGSAFAVKTRCEGIGPRLSSWRRHATATANFGLLVRHLSSQGTRRRDGTYLVKAGAVLEGHEPVTLRVGAADRGEVGLVYGNATRGHARQPATAPTEVTFSPCQGRPRSGYVGGLVFGGKPRPVTLEVRSQGSTELLPLKD